MSGLSPLAQADLAEAFAEAYVSGATANGLPVANVGQGSSLGAIGNGAGLMGLLVSRNVQYAVRVSRLRNADGSLSSTGIDIDSWFAPFAAYNPALLRTGSIAATGAVQLSAPAVVTTPIFIAVGAILQTLGGGIQFEIIADSTNSAYNAVTNGYYILAGSAAVTVTVQCLTPGVVGNVPVGAISQVYNGSTGAQIIGVSNVTNLSAFTTGSASEDDNAYADRAEKALGGGTTGTSYAIYVAAMGVQVGLTVQVGDALDANGNVVPGTSTVFVNELDQSGAPSAALLGLVQVAVFKVKPAGSVLGAPLAPTRIVVNGSVTLNLDGSQPQSAVIAAAQAAFENYINSIPMVPIVFPPASSGATTLSYAKVLAAIGPLVNTLSGSQGIAGVAYPTNLQLNGGYGDISATYGQQIVAGTLSIATA